MKVSPENVERWVQLGFMIASGVPGAVAGILSFIQQFAPKEIAQYWTEPKLTLYLANYDVNQDKILDAFDARRKPVPAPEPAEDE